MFTLMPVAAFAAVGDPAVVVNSYASDKVEAGEAFDVAVEDGVAGTNYNYLFVAVDDEDDDATSGGYELPPFLRNRNY